MGSRVFECVSRSLVNDEAMILPSSIMAHDAVIAEHSAAKIFKLFYPSDCYFALCVVKLFYLDVDGVFIEGALDVLAPLCYDNAA